MHVTPEDFRRLLATAAVYLVTYIAVAYAIAVLIAVTLKGFRTRFALQSSLVISGIVSVLYLSALMLDWRYLLRHKPDGKAEILWMIMLDAGLLCFVWIAPSGQYFILRRQPLAVATPAADQSIRSNESNAVN